MPLYVLFQMKFDCIIDETDTGVTNTKGNMLMSLM